MDLDRFTFDQDRLERLNAETVQRRRSIQKHRVLANNFFKDVPNHRLLTLDHFARLLDGRGVLLLLELVIDERLEQFERHLLWQPALMQFQLWADDDDRTTGIVDALTE